MQIFKSKIVSRGTKIKYIVYKTLIRLVPLYARETSKLTLTKDNERILSIFERRILKRYFGPIEEKPGM